MTSKRLQQLVQFFDADADLPMTNLRRSTIVGGTTATICVLLILQSTIKYWAPIDNPATLEEVSGLYGPGTYYAWLLAMLSAALTQYYRPIEERRLFSADLISAFAYIIVSIVDMSRRDAQPNGVNDLQALAAFHIVYVASWFSFIFCFLTRSNSWLNLSYTTSTILVLWLLGISLKACRSNDLHCLGLGIFVSVVSPITWVETWGRIQFINFRSLMFSASVPFLVAHILIPNFGHHPRSLAPRTSSSILELDQGVALATMIMVLSYQWEIWNAIPFLLRYGREKFGSRSPQSSESRTSFLT
ncbi:hypothetical protein CPB86DRAFT_787120 [Serendipita vermifera]|nr:hypothetical protein CPB86DRAFT_787120 [Serendipita vermifera]